MNFIQATTLLIVYSFVIFTMYIVLSDPFDKMVSPFEDINMSGSDAYVESATGDAKLVFNMVFAFLMLFPIIWFIIWVFRREPDWRYRQ